MKCFLSQLTLVVFRSEHLRLGTEAIRLDPKNANTYNNRGVAWEEKGEHDKAAKDFAKAELLKAE